MTYFRCSRSSRSHGRFRSSSVSCSPGSPELLDDVQRRHRSEHPGRTGRHVQDLIDSAINARSTVGLIGSLTAVYAGLAWMSNLRDALTAMWDYARDKPNFVIVKLKDGAALLGLALAMAVSLGLSAVSSGPIMRRVVEFFNLRDIVGIGVVLRIAALLFSIAATAAVFTWVIARLPREPVAFPQRDLRRNARRNRIRASQAGRLALPREGAWSVLPVSRSVRSSACSCSPISPRA